MNKFTENKETIHIFALCTSILLFVPFAFGLLILFGDNPNLIDKTIVATICVVIEIISIIISAITMDY